MSAILRIKSRFAILIFTALIVLLVIPFTYQYYLSKSESHKLLHYLSNKEKQLINIEKYGEKADQELREANKEMSIAHVLIPPALNIKSFIESFERWSKGSGVIVKDFNWREEKKNFYITAYCITKLAGDKEALKNLWNRKSEIERFVIWGEEKPLDTGIEVKLMIYSIQWSKPKQFDVNSFKKKSCEEFKTKIWLWPFSKRIREIQKKLDRVCLKIKEHADIAYKIELLKAKKHAIALFSEIFRNLKKANNLEEPASLEQLISEMAHPDPNRRWDAVTSLGASGDRRAVPPLMKALKKDMKQRTGIAMAIIPALGQLKDERAVPLLLKALNKMDEDWLGREAAAWALGDIGSSKAVPDLVRAAWMAETRYAAIKTLSGMGDPRAIDVLVSALSEQEDPEVQEAAIAGLIHIGEKAVPVLLDKLDTRHREYTEDYERAQAAMILGKLGDQRAVDPLTQALDDPSPEVIKRAETALESLTKQ